MGLLILQIALVILTFLLAIIPSGHGTSEKPTRWQRVVVFIILAGSLVLQIGIICWQWKEEKLSQEQVRNEKREAEDRRRAEEADKLVREVRQHTQAIESISNLAYPLDDLAAEVTFVIEGPAVEAYLGRLRKTFPPENISSPMSMQTFNSNMLWRGAVEPGDPLAPRPDDPAEASLCTALSSFMIGVVFSQNTAGTLLEYEKSRTAWLKEDECLEIGIAHHKTWHGPDRSGRNWLIYPRPKEKNRIRATVFRLEAGIDRRPGVLGLMDLRGLRWYAQLTANGAKGARPRLHQITLVSRGVEMDLLASDHGPSHRLNDEVRFVNCTGIVPMDWGQVRRPIGTMSEITLPR